MVDTLPPDEPGPGMRRLRPGFTAAQLPEVYHTPHDHRIYGRGHAERVDTTICAARRAAAVYQTHSAADLSCGNAAIIDALPDHITKYRGDIAPGYPICGPIEHTIFDIPLVDLFICCETLEHLDQPQTTLRRIRSKTRTLVLSTPVGNWDDTNAQHLWAWNDAGMRLMLRSAGFTVDRAEQVDTRRYGEAYCYGIWVCT